MQGNAAFGGKSGKKLLLQGDYAGKELGRAHRQPCLKLSGYFGKGLSRFQRRSRKKLLCRGPISGLEDKRNEKSCPGGEEGKCQKPSTMGRWKARTDLTEKNVYEAERT